MERKPPDPERNEHKGDEQAQKENNIRSLLCNNKIAVDLDR